MVIHVFNSSIVSGPETLVLPALARSDWNAEVWFLQESRLQIDDEKNPIFYAQNLGLKVRSIKVRSRFDWLGIKILAKKILKTQPQFLHGHDVKASLYIAFACIYNLFLSLFGILKEPYYKPFLVTTHHGVRARFTLKLRLYERLYVYVSYLFFDRMLAVCTSDASLLKSVFFDSSKVKLHLNGVDRKLILKEEKAFLKFKYRDYWSKQLQIQITTEDLLFGIVGRLSPEKNHLETLALFKGLINSWQLKNSSELKRSKLILLLFGSGPMEFEIKKFINDMDLVHSVFMLGYQQNIMEKIAALDFVVSLSSAEGLPINLIEAGWAGTGVIANAIDGNLDLLIAPNMGILINRELSRQQIIEKILNIIQDQELIDKIGELFQKHVASHFSETIWLDKLSQIYCELDVEFNKTTTSLHQEAE